MIPAAFSVANARCPRRHRVKRRTASFASTSLEHFAAFAVLGARKMAGGGAGLVTGRVFLLSISQTVVPEVTPQRRHQADAGGRQGGDRAWATSQALEIRCD